MKNTILIIENDNLLRKMFEGFLKSQIGFLNISSTRDTIDALNIIDQVDISLVVIGFRVSEMDALEFVTHLEKYHPKIRVIILTDGVSQIFRASFDSLKTPVFFEKMSDIQFLAKRICAELNMRHGGQVFNISLSSFLQMIEMEKKSCTLYVRSKSKSGNLHIRDGKLVSAKYDNMTGDNAAFEILSWKNVFIDIDYTVPVIDEEIMLPMIPLLLEALKLADEKLDRPDLRKHKRRNCMIVMDYEINGRNHHGFLWDISFGGAFMETDHSLSVGAKLTLDLSVPAQSLSCPINAEVVRRNDRGVGICFEELTDDQKTVINALIATPFPLSSDEADASESSDNESLEMAESEDTEIADAESLEMAAPESSETFDTESLETANSESIEPSDAEPLKMAESEAIKSLDAESFESADPKSSNSENSTGEGS